MRYETSQYGLAAVTSIPLYLSAEAACSYLEGQTSRVIMPGDDFALDSDIYSHLINQGFRRSGNQVYKPYCQSCCACIPTRLPVQQFQANRQQKRCLQRNAATRTVIRPAVFDIRHFELYHRYLAARHQPDSPNESSPETFMAFFDSDWCDTWFVEFYIGGRLAAVAVVDALDQGLSAVYTFFDPEFADYSPGVYAVLWQIETARELQLDYVYLGFWIKECRKMSYKNQYQPLYGLIAENWQAIGR